MQHMPDKEFDNLFRDKFKDAEIEPSANLWANIESELEPKRKRVFPIYWMAAASVAVAITAMLVFQKEDVIELKGKTEMANVVAPITTVPETTSVTETTTVDATTAQVGKANFAALKTSSKTINGAENTTAKNNSTNNQDALQPKEEFAHLPIKKADPIAIDVAPIKDAVVENPTVIAYQPTSKDNIVSTTDNEIDNTTERKGIRNVGDLVNFVVDKVDKRDKKILKFKTDEDDESSLIGINIGFLKLNKKHK